MRSEPLSARTGSRACSAQAAWGKSTGNEEVYVQTFPSSNQKWRISTDGGSQPTWRADGRELFYLAPDDTLIAVPIEARPAFTPGVASPLFQARLGGPRITRNHYAPSRDGQRFLIVTPDRQTSPTPITVIVNWVSTLR